MNYLHELESLADSLYRHLMKYVEKDKYGFPLYHVPNQRTIKDCIGQAYGYKYWDDYIIARKNNNVTHMVSHSDKRLVLYQKLVEYRDVLDYIMQKPDCIIHKISGMSEISDGNTKNSKPQKDLKYRRFKPVFFGNSWRYKNYWGFYKKRIAENWQLNRYPATIFGSMGSGKTEVYTTFSQKWMANQEGYILLSADINNDRHYDFILNVAKFNNRLDDVYVLKGYEDYYYSRSDEENKNDTLENTHTIDPINPLIGNLWAFKQLFGENVGLMIHHVGQEIKNRGCLMDWQTLASLISWENLNGWVENKAWGEATSHIESYVISTGNSDMHADNCVIATRMIKALKKYTEKGLFSMQPDINLIDIFRQRKILAVLLSSQIHGAMDEKMLNLLMTINVHHAARTMDENNIEGNHWQNILLIEPETLFFEDTWTPTNLIKEFFNTLSSSSNWVFGGYSPYKDSHVMNEAIEASQTIFMMKTESRAEDLPDGLRLKILSKMVDKEQVLADYSVHAHLPKEKRPWPINDLSAGYGYFFTQGLSDKKQENNHVNHDSNQYYFKRIFSDYYGFMKITERYLYKTYHNNDVLPKVPQEHEEKIMIK